MDLTKQRGMLEALSFINSLTNAPPASHSGGHQGAYRKSVLFFNSKKSKESWHVYDKLQSQSWEQLFGNHPRNRKSGERSTQRTHVVWWTMAHHWWYCSFLCMLHIHWWYICKTTGNIVWGNMSHNSLFCLVCFVSTSIHAIQEALVSLTNVVFIPKNGSHRTGCLAEAILPSPKLECFNKNRSIHRIPWLQPPISNR